MSVTTFEDARWRNGDQKLEFRHSACLDLIEPGRVLDIGCGDGLLLSLLKEKGITGQGIDISQEAVQACREKGIEAQVWSVDEKLPFENASFDTVVLLDVLEYVYDPESVLKEVARISRNHVIIGVPNFSSLPARMQVVLGRVPENNRPQKGHVYWFNYSVLSSCIKAASLTLTKERMNTFSLLRNFPKSFININKNLFALSFVVSCSIQTSNRDTTTGK